jgi:threonyl-tRNA synthetase
MPERFGLTYTDADDRQRTPVMIHRALLGSIERFLGILIEHHAGEFPVWLAPVQARVLPIADRHADYASSVLDALRDAGVRAEIDRRTESVGKKIRDAELAKTPYMLVVGDNEQQQGGVSLRRHREGDLGLMPLAEAAERIANEVR